MYRCVHTYIGVPQHWGAPNHCFPRWMTHPWHLDSLHHRVWERGRRSPCELLQRPCRQRSQRLPWCQSLQSLARGHLRLHSLSSLGASYIYKQINILKQCVYIYIHIHMLSSCNLLGDLFFESCNVWIFALFADWAWKNPEGDRNVMQ